MTSETLVLWDDALLGYDLGDHPLDPVRVELTIALARAFDLFERPGVTVSKPVPADDERLLTVHTPDYLEVVKAASIDQRVHGHGLGTPDNPTFPGMHDASALIAKAQALSVQLAKYSITLTVPAMPARRHRSMRKCSPPTPPTSPR